MMIDKNRLSPVEQRQYEALLAKAALADDETTLPPGGTMPGQMAGSSGGDTWPVTPVNPASLAGTTGFAGAMNAPTPANRTNQVAPASQMGLSPAGLSPMGSSPVGSLPAGLSPTGSLPTGSPTPSPEIPPAPALTAAIARLEELEQSLTWRECVTTARQYALLGETEENLARTLFDLKQTDEANYTAYLAALDKSLALVRKSGLFREIGKSSREPAYCATTWGGAGSSVMEKIQAEAEEIQRNNPELNRLSAIARAWENHPELVREYNAAYQVRQTF